MKTTPNQNRFVRRLKSLNQKYRNGVWVGVSTSLICIFVFAVFNGSAQDEKRIIFRREPGLDFKDSEILGNPRQAILLGQESLFTKTQRSVLESEAQLKTEVAALRAEVEQLKTQPSITNTKALSLPVSPTGTSTASYGSYGPLPAPMASPQVEATAITNQLGAPAPGVVPAEIKDDIGKTQSAPVRSPFGLGTSESISGRVRQGANLITFAVKSTGKAFLRKPVITLPSGSYVKGTLLTGVEAPEGKSYPALLQLDYAYIIPNDKRLDLAGCFMIAKAQGDLSTERVQMQATKLSCVSRRNGMFERDINGFVADDADNSFAIMGTVNSKQDRVAASAFLAGIVAGIGKAVQQAQTTNQVTPLGESQSILTGDQTKYIGAGGATEAATLVTQWYLKQAQNLLPTINVGSGQGVWVIMQDQVELPKEYFTQSGIGGIQNASIYSHFTRIVD